MKEETRNELSAKLEELKTKEAVAWNAYRAAEDEVAKLEKNDPLQSARKLKEDTNKEWLALNKAYEGLKVLLALEAE